MKVNKYIFFIISGVISGFLMISFANAENIDYHYTYAYDQGFTNFYNFTDDTAGNGCSASTYYLLDKLIINFTKYPKPNHFQNYVQMTQTGWNNVHDNYIYIGNSTQKYLLNTGTTYQREFYINGKLSGYITIQETDHTNGKYYINVYFTDLSEVSNLEGKQIINISYDNIPNGSFYVKCSPTSNAIGNVKFNHIDDFYLGNERTANDLYRPYYKILDGRGSASTGLTYADIYYNYSNGVSRLTIYKNQSENPTKISLFYSNPVNDYEENTFNKLDIVDYTVEDYLRYITINSSIGVSEYIEQTISIPQPSNTNEVQFLIFDKNTNSLISGANLKIVSNNYGNILYNQICDYTCTVNLPQLDTYTIYVNKSGYIPYRAELYYPSSGYKFHVYLEPEPQKQNYQTLTDIYVYYQMYNTLFPLPNVLVYVNNSPYYTGGDGHLVISLNKSTYYQYRAIKNGFYTKIGSFTTGNGNYSYVTIEMFPKTQENVSTNYTLDIYFDIKSIEVPAEVGYLQNIPYHLEFTTYDYQKEAYEIDPLTGKVTKYHYWYNMPAGKIESAEDPLNFSLLVKVFYNQNLVVDKKVKLTEYMTKDQFLNKHYIAKYEDYGEWVFSKSSNTSALVQVYVTGGSYGNSTILLKEKLINFVNTNTTLPDYGKTQPKLPEDQSNYYINPSQNFADLFITFFGNTVFLGILVTASVVALITRESGSDKVGLFVGGGMIYFFTMIGWFPEYFMAVMLIAIAGLIAMKGKEIIGGFRDE